MRIPVLLVESSNWANKGRELSSRLCACLCEANKLSGITKRSCQLAAPLEKAYRNLLIADNQFLSI
jgi:hypothetical protein